jgi:hypothetical protein
LYLTHLISLDHRKQSGFEQGEFEFPKSSKIAQGSGSNLEIIQIKPGKA